MYSSQDVPFMFIVFSFGHFRRVFSLKLPFSDLPQFFKFLFVFNVSQEVCLQGSSSLQVVFMVGAFFDNLPNFFFAKPPQVFVSIQLLQHSLHQVANRVRHDLRCCVASVWVLHVSMTVRGLDYSIPRLGAERVSSPLDRFPMPTADQRDAVAPTATDLDTNASAHLSNRIDAPPSVLRCVVPFVVGTVVSSTLSTPICWSFLHLLDPNSSAPPLSRSTAPSPAFRFLRSSTPRRRNGASLSTVHPPPRSTFLGPKDW
mmetsp:Transcript_8463/g.52906  ORF Transcript_8463/g.52906 Transcript_8463/m.52906 type:complete len:258 (+) Transcript_8463:1785-2558(+)